ILTIINTALMLLVVYLLLSHGLVRTGEVPVVGGYMPSIGGGSSNARAAAGDEGTPGVPTPGASALAVASRVPATPTPSGFKGGEAVLVRRNAAFRGSPDFKVDAFCRIQDKTPGTIITQQPGTSVDELKRSKMIYPISVKQATCVNGGPV